MKKLFSLLILIFAILHSNAQDPNFSQFFASPLTSNPTFTGLFNGQLRVAGNYRNQWPTINNAFTTYTLSVDMGLLQDRIPETDILGFGIMAFSDKSGNGILQNNMIALSTSYHKGLDEDGMHQLGLGFQGSYVNKRLDVSNAKFEDMLQFDGFTGITSEFFDQRNLNISYFDLNAGLLYNGSTNGDNNIYFGASFYHLNRYQESFQGGQFYLPMRLTFQAGARLPFGEYNAINLSANHSRQAAALNTTIGGAYELNLSATADQPTNLYLGAWYRLKDAVIPYIGLEFGSFHIGASYDVNTSNLKPASNMRGGAEFSIIYIKQPTDRSTRKLNCPKF